MVLDGLETQTMSVRVRGTVTFLTYKGQFLTDSVNGERADDTFPLLAFSVRVTAL